MNIDTESAKPDEHLFLLYLLGGVEILHEKLIENSSDIMNNLKNFLEEIHLPDESMVEEMGINFQ